MFAHPPGGFTNTYADPLFEPDIPLSLWYAPATMVFADIASV
jgi:hypothetical protein